MVSHWPENAVFPTEADEKDESTQPDLPDDAVFQILFLVMEDDKILHRDVSLLKVLITLLKSERYRILALKPFEMEEDFESEQGDLYMDQIHMLLSVFTHTYDYESAGMPTPSRRTNQTRSIHTEFPKKMRR